MTGSDYGRVFRRAALAFFLSGIVLALPSASALAFGALYVNEDDPSNFGFTKDYQTPQGADRRAKRECGPNCSFKMRFDTGCAAYYTDTLSSTTKTYYGYGKGRNLNEAEDNASADCKRRGGNWCIGAAWGCTNPPKPVVNKPKKSEDKGDTDPLVSIPGLRVKRQIFTDGARCSSWCSTMERNARSECSGENKPFVAVDCRCNETEPPNFAEIRFQCALPKAAACTEKSETVTDPQRTEFIYFNDNARCSAWCPIARDSARAICKGEGKDTALIDHCSCAEGASRPYAAIKFRCQTTTKSCVGGSPGTGETGDVKGSMMLLVDTSGSMQGDKLEAAKSAAMDSVNSLVPQGIEVSILAFSGECDSPISRSIPFTRDIGRLRSFISSLTDGGGTPLSTALVEASRRMQANQTPGNTNSMIVVLADGENACTGLEEAISRIQQHSRVVRHETVGLEVGSDSQAARDLRRIAEATGGSYHGASHSTELRSVFRQAIEAMSLLDLIGGFTRK